jgi:tRNA threonylcarbamoyladenosine biosynthesis protein TsaE
MSEINWISISTEEIKNLDDLKNFCSKLQKQLPEQAVVALCGPMAAGKTELVKTFGRIFGLEGVSSPTFALHQRYENAKIQIDHWDLYRTQSEDELESAGFWDLFTGDESRIIFIEWPERMRLVQIPKAWPLFLVDIQVLKDFRKLDFFKR